MREEYCKLESNCTDKPCKEDVYFLHGWEEPASRGLFDTFDVDLPHHKTFKCILPHKKCVHEPRCILDAFHKEKRRLSGRSKVGLVGISFGGMLSQLYANKYPNEVSKLGLFHSFSTLNGSYRRFRTLFEPEDIKNAEQVDYKLKHNEEIDVLVRNCHSDLYVYGKPPKIKGADSKTNVFCVHGYVPRNTLKELKEFLNK